MRLWISSLFLLSAVFADSIPHEYITAAEVSQLRENGETVVVAFSTRHCPHCLRFGEQLPQYRETFEQLEINAKIHKMDTQDDANKDFVKEFEINGVPTVYIFVGEADGIKYEGNREASDIANFVKKVQDLKVEVLLDQSDAENFKNSHPALIAVVPSVDEKINVIEAAAKDNIAVNVAYLAVDVAKGLGLTEGLHLFRKDGHISLDEIPTQSSKLNQWIKIAILPSISPFPSAAKDIFSSGIHDILFLIDENSNIATEQWVRDLAEDYRGKVVFASIDKSDESSSHALDFFLVEQSNVKGPIVRLFNDDKRKQYWMEEEVSKESLVAWIQKYLDGEIAAHMKSEVLDDDWNAKPLTVLAGSNFNEIAFDKEKNVFVFFHAPWCGHCKRLVPQWEKLALSYANNDKVIIAKIDATANDVDDGYTDIQGFPTLRLYKSGDNSILEYSGDRSLEALQKYVEEHTGFAPSSEVSDEEVHDHDHDEF